MDTLTPIQQSDAVIVKIIHRVEAILQDDADYKFLNDNGLGFKSIQIYGTSEAPLFLAPSVYKFLQPRGTNKNTFFKKFKEGKEKFTQKAQVLRNGQLRIVSSGILTKLGLMRAMYMSDSKLAEVFRDFIMEVLEELHINHAEAWEASATATQKKLNNIEKQLADEHERAGALERTNFEQSHEIKKHAEVEDIFENAELQGENEQKMYHLMQKKFLKPVCIYVVDTSYVQSKKKRPKYKNSRSIHKTPIKKGQSNFEHFGLSESDEDNSADDKSDDDELDYDYHRCNRYNLEANPNEEYYFFISPWVSKTINQAQVKRGVFKYAFDVHIENKEHYAYMVELLTDYDTKIIAGVFKTTYSNIIESAQSSFINIATRALRKQVAIHEHVPHEFNILAQRNGTDTGICRDKPSEKKTRKALANADSSGSDVDGYNDSS
jgi:hypothetical protein